MVVRIHRGQWQGSVQRFDADGGRFFGERLRWDKPQWWASPSSTINRTHLSRLVVPP